MSSLKNVYCLGCKTRHETVEIQAVKRMTVRNSIRHQAYGLCPEGKKWTKLLKKDDIPKGVSIEDHTKPAVENKEEMKDPQGEVFDIEPMPIFERVKEAQRVEVEDKELEVVEQPTVVDTVITPMVESTVEPMVESPKIEISEPAYEIEEEEEDDEDDEGEVMVLNHVRPRRPKEVEKREPINPLPRSRLRNDSHEELQERAFSMGERMGFLAAQESGIEFVDRFEGALSRTRIPSQYHSYFYHGFIQGGSEFVDENVMERHTTEDKPPQQTTEMKPTTVAGIAGIGIFGAWLASRIKGGNN